MGIEMKHTMTTATLLLLLTLAGGAASADNNFGIGVKAGTLGIGLEGRWQPLPYIDFRLGMNRYDIDDEGSQAGINYNATFNLDTLYGTANFRFPLSPFRVTAGVFSNGNELQLQSMDTPTFDIGGTSYSSAEVGTLRSVTAFSGSAPYLGFGYDFSLFGKVGLNMDFGALWQGEPNVTMTTDGLLANDQNFQQSLENERLQIEDEMSDYKAWPVLSLGFVFNF